MSIKRRRAARTEHNRYYETLPMVDAFQVVMHEAQRGSVVIATRHDFVEALTTPQIRLTEQATITRCKQDSNDGELPLRTPKDL